MLGNIHAGIMYYIFLGFIAWLCFLIFSHKA